MQKILIKFSTKNTLRLDDVYNEIINQIFFFHKTFYSFRDKNGTLYYRDSNSTEPVWKEAIFDKESGDVKDGKIISIDFLTIFKKYIPDVILDNNIPLTFDDLSKKYKEVFEKNIKNSQTLILNILFFNLIKNIDEFVFNKKDLSNEDISLVNTLNDFEDKSEQILFLKKYIKKKYDSNLLEDILMKIYGKDNKTLSKINIFFDSRVNLPGKYLIKHNELIMSSIFFENIKKKKS